MEVILYRFFIFLYHPNQTPLEDATKDPSICPTYASMVLGDVLYALSYRANFLYLILKVDRSDSNRFRTHIFHVRQTILFRPTDRRYSSADNTSNDRAAGQCPAQV